MKPRDKVKGLAFVSLLIMFLIIQVLSPFKGLDVIQILVLSVLSVILLSLIQTGIDTIFDEIEKTRNGKD